MDIPALRDAIDTIVIVMMENRSFDHVLGHLSHEDYGRRIAAAVESTIMATHFVGRANLWRLL